MENFRNLWIRTFGNLFDLTFIKKGLITMAKKKKKKSGVSDVIKALHHAEREIQLERNGYAHPWVATTVTHKCKKCYDRKRDRKNFDYSSGFFSDILKILHNIL